MRACIAAIFIALVCAPPSFAQASGPGDGLARLIARLEALVQNPAVDQAADDFEALLSPNASADIVERVSSALFAPGVTRAVVRERERHHLQGTLPGDGYRLGLEMFTETANVTGRIVSALMDVRRPHADDSPDAWRIADLTPATSVDGLHRLSVDSSQQFAARDFVLRSEDLTLTLVTGSVFLVRSGAGPSGVILLGRGEMEFRPPTAAERQQVALIAGSAALVAEFDTAFIRMNPAEYAAQVAGASLEPVNVDTRALRRARGVFADESPKSFTLDLGDLSQDPWHLIPPMGDFFAEVRTRRHGSLTYARAGSEVEDVTLFERAKYRDIARYASGRGRRLTGMFYSEDDLAEFEVLDYDIEASVTPHREQLEGLAQLKIRVRAEAVTSLTLRLAERLRVSSVRSLELGRLLHVRIRTRDTIVVNLPFPLSQGREITLVVAYAGGVAAQDLDEDALGSQSVQQRSEFPPEPKYLLSTKSYWYPQAPNSGYATATLRVTVPDGYGCVATGELAPGSPEQTTDGRSSVYRFRSVEPVRYLSLLVARFRVAARETIVLGGGLATGIAQEARSPGDPTGASVRHQVALRVEAAPRQQGRGREAAEWAQDIIPFYANLMGDAPYPDITVALVEDTVPGGHSPAHFVMLNVAPPAVSFAYRRDPAAFEGYAEFFLAHELAHQWWGQAVGWQNYHEQWLSEGFAQYFAALYAEHRYGPAMFESMLRQFRRWAVAESDQGPIYLGYRLGQIKADQRVRRALLYNKGAAVLHMLRRLAGDEAFFNALRRFYDTHKFQKAGTDALRLAFEAETGRSFERFFASWIYGSALPSVTLTSVVEEQELVVRAVQLGDVTELPVTVSVSYADGRTEEFIFAVAAREAVMRIPLSGTPDKVDFNPDTTLATINGG